MDSDSKLAISYHLGGREHDDTVTFMRDLASQIVTLVQLTSDGLSLYEPAIFRVFG